VIGNEHSDVPAVLPAAAIELNAFWRPAGPVDALPCPDPPGYLEKYRYFQAP
jgi:hypothetical protein